MRLAPILIATACVTATGLAVAGCHPSHNIIRKHSPVVPSAAAGADGKPGFVGTWAVAETACGHAAWTMTAQRLQSPGAVDCSVSQLTQTLAGYTINTACSQGGVDTPGRIVMTLNGGPPAQALTLSGGPFAEPVSLVRCTA